MTMAFKMPVLLCPELPINRAAFEEHVMRRKIDNLAKLQHENAVAIDKAGQAMRDNDHGAPVRNALQIRAEHGLALRIERAGRFVQDQDARVVNQSTSNRQPLFLPT